MSKPLVWSEQESGDWEACVTASYLTGMVYAGWSAYPLGIYSQPEREALELVFDEPQDYNTTDARAVIRYGHSLRLLSTGSIDHAVTRVGIGLVLAGYGGLLIATNAPIHSVFYLPTSPTAGLLYDPLAANKSAGVSIAASRIVSWSKGAGPNDAREVRENELATAPGNGDDMPGPYTEAAFDHLVNKRSKLLVDAPFRNAPSKTAPVIKTYLAGTGFYPTHTVQAEGATFYGAWLYNGSSGYVLGYFQSGSLEPLSDATNPPDAGGGDASAWESWYAARPKSAIETWLADAPESDLSD